MLDKINLVKDTLVKWKTLEDLASTSDFSQSRKHLTDRNAYDTKILVVIGATRTDIIGSTYKIVHDFCDLLLVMCMDHRKMTKAFRLSKAASAPKGRGFAGKQCKKCSEKNAGKKSYLQRVVW